MPHNTERLTCVELFINQFHLALFFFRFSSPHIRFVRSSFGWNDNNNWHFYSLFSLDLVANLIIIASQALGNLYFIEKSIANIKIWNFLTHEWDAVEGKSIHTGNIEAVATKEKAKFPQHFFPEVRTASNSSDRAQKNSIAFFLAVQMVSKGILANQMGCKWHYRRHGQHSLVSRCIQFGCCRRASVDVLQEQASSSGSYFRTVTNQFGAIDSNDKNVCRCIFSFHKDIINGMAPYFVFGDFNFRCDTEGVVKVSKWSLLNVMTQIELNCYSLFQKLTEELSIHRILNVKNDHYKVQYRNADGQNVLTIGKKEFVHAEHQTRFKESWVSVWSVLAF